MAARTWILAFAIGILGGLSMAAQQRSPASSAVRSLASGVYSDAQAKRGEPMYVDNCAFCHGADVQGTDFAPPLTAAALSARWHSKTLSDLFEYQQAFMPWLRPGGFGRPQNVDILAYVLKKGGFPVGADLPLDAEAQRQIRIIAAKP